jgi:hypothetical protein
VATRTPRERRREQGEAPPRAVAALIHRGGAVIPVYASEKAEKVAREGRGFFIEWHREE